MKSLNQLRIIHISIIMVGPLLRDQPDERPLAHDNVTQFFYFNRCRELPLSKVTLSVMQIF